MTTLYDLSLSQLAAAYGRLAQIEVHGKFFKSKSKAVARVETLIAEQNLTIADVFLAAGVNRETPSDDGDGHTLEFTPETGHDDKAGEVSECEIMPEPQTETNAFNNDGFDDQTPSEDKDKSMLEREEGDCNNAPFSDTTVSSGAENSPDDEAPPEQNTPELLEPESSDPLDASVLFADDKVQIGARDLLVCYLIDAGLDAETATQAAQRAVEALKKPQSAMQQQPRANGGKQAQVIEMLRRPEGATIAQMVAATGWQSHTCRGVLAGALKKRLGLTIVSAKEASGQRIYRLPT
ncbi:putative DUF3489 domain-containing protein [Azospirillaceae bacterium]